MEISMNTESSLSNKEMILDENSSNKFNQQQYEISKRISYSPQNTNILESSITKVGIQDEQRIGIFTDNHLGFKEKHSLRAHDSFRSFEECLQILKGEKVDFIINGGDIFHDISPSQETVLKTMKMTIYLKYF